MKSFYRQRFFMFLAISVGWCLYYFCRKTFVASMPELVRDRGLEKTHLGSIASSFTILYGVSKLISGIMSDNFSGKLLLSAGLFVSGVCCLLFPLSDHVLLLSVLWGCNGYVQGFGWPGCANVLKSWYSRDEIATWWSLLSAAGQHWCHNYSCSVHLCCYKLWMGKSLLLDWFNNLHCGGVAVDTGQGLT